MANNNAIGTGALILTANADRMLAGMDAAGDAASKKAATISQKVGKATDGGKGGGLLGNILGGVAGGLAGAGLFTALVKGPELALRAFEELDKRATGFDKGALAGIKQSFHSLQNAGLGILQKFVSAAAPAIMVLAGALLNLFEKLNPVIQGVASVFEAFAFTFAELLSELIDSIGDLGIDTTDWGKNTLDVLEAIGKGFAYVWDTVKAGAGVLAVVAGVITEGLGLIVKMIGDAVLKLSELAQQLPESIRPDWIGDVGNTVKGWGASIDGFGERMRNWGVGAIQGFGNSAVAVEGFFNRVRGRLADVKADIADLGAATELKLSGAFQRGSTDAYKIIARSSTDGMLEGQNAAKKQLEEQRKGNGILNKILAKMATSGFGLGAI